MTHLRAAELAMARACKDFGEDACQIWLGIGLATLERIEAGEIVPDPELEGRIDRFLTNRGGGPLAAALPGPHTHQSNALAGPLPDRRLSHSGGPTCGGAAVTGSAAFSDRGAR